ncbi:MAG: peptidase U32 family protein [Eubacterium sp.]
MKTEILAPVGNREMLIAAVRCGANAVYLGTKDLNARRNADNFGTEELTDAVTYCHQREVKVYLTVNTLVADSEMQTAYKTIENAMHSGVDGFIVQDLGLAKMIKHSFPSAKLHASTQCSVNTPDGFNALKELGFSRAVIPREMSLDEIKEIRKNTDLELEMFVHGALCMCVSGQCYLSAMLGSRSGNRGLCAQPCRLAFSADDSGSCDLSLKDLSLISKIKEIEGAGIISLKIEGRMKRPEYVAATVTACKKAIENNYTQNDDRILKSVFSRSGFTDGYFTGLRENMFGTRQKEDVVAANSVLKELSHLYDNENPLIPIDLELTFKENKPISLTAVTERKTVTVSSVVPEKAISKPVTKEILEKRLSKLGNTQYYLRNISIDLDNGLIVSASEINELRRKAVEKLNEQKPITFEQNPLSAIKSTHKKSEPYYTARFSNPDSIPNKHPFKRIFIPIWSSDEDFLDNRAGVEIPRGLFGVESKLKKQLEHLKKIGVKNALCSNLGAYKTAQNMGFKVFGDFGLNAFNSETASQFNSPILSLELTIEQANRINAADTGLIAYGKLPLMITRNCPVKNRIGCNNCMKQGILTDRKGYKFRVKCSSYPCLEILNSIPLYLGDRMDEINTDFIHFYFTDETVEEVKQLVNMYKNQYKFDREYTRGLYYRGVK